MGVTADSLFWASRNSLPINSLRTLVFDALDLDSVAGLFEILWNQASPIPLVVLDKGQLAFCRPLILASRLSISHSALARDVLVPRICLRSLSLLLIISHTLRSRGLFSSLLIFLELSFVLASEVVHKDIQSGVRESERPFNILPR